MFTDVRTRARLRGATVTTAVIAALGVIVPLAQADSGGYHYTGKVWAADPVQQQPVVQGHPVTYAKPVKTRTPRGARALSTHQAKAPSWPAAASGSVTLPQQGSTVVQAGSSPVSLAAAPTAMSTKTPPASAPHSVRVSVASHKQSQAAGVDGVLVGLTRGDGKKAAGKVIVKVDYSSIAQAYGGGWASRLHLVAMPGCALTTPQLAACQSRKPLATTNDTTAQTLSAAVDLTASAATATGSAVAAVSDTGGSQGNYTATSLSASGAWSQSASGAFTYNYPIAVPASLGGSAPSVGLSYNSQSVDGETSARNAQSSSIGDGWSYEPGFIERSYKTCDNNGIKDSYDECWAGYNATLSLGAHSGELVRDSSGIFHLQTDDGTKIERLTGADNDLWQGEYYKVTTTDGTAYYFGVDHTPGTTSDASTNSAWSLPVYHPKSSDPCYDAAKGDKSQCSDPIGYRFNLDFVVDPHGNVQRYDYKTETNYYNMGLGQVAASGDGGTMTSYVRAGYLTQISYGYQLADARAGHDPAARVLFTSAQRCTTSDTVCTAGNLSDSTATNWPDVPYDIHCEAGDKTSGDGDDVCHIGSPTFWSTYRLKTITTQVNTVDGFKSVDQYDLKQIFSDAGGVIDPVTGKTEHPEDAGQLQSVMWLQSIQHTGLDTTGGGTPPVSLDPVTFTGIEADNRVDGLTPAAPPLFHPRISSVHTETGESIAATYADPQCSRVNHTMPASADSNTKACFPVYWNPPGSVDPISDWFNKSLVTQVSDSDLTAAGSPAKVTNYQYGNAAWHRDDSDLTDDKYRTWNQFHGFSTITVLGGASPDPVTKTVTTYLQGMDGDYKANGSRRSVTLGSVTDSEWLTGTPQETDTYNTTAPGSPVIAKNITDALSTVETAHRARTAWTSEDPAPADLSTLPDLSARRLDTTTSRSLSLLADTTWRTAKTVTRYDAFGRVTQADDQGDVADPKQENCTTTSYAPAPASNPMMLTYPSETISVSGPCGTTPSATTTLVDKRIFYDGDGSIATPGTYGKLGQSWPSDGASPQVHSLGYMTAVQSIKSYSGSGSPTFVMLGALSYDKYGRVTKSLDGAGATTTTGYTPATGILPTTIAVTNPLGWGSSTAVDPGRGAVTESIDANGRVTDSAYDALGRRTAAWLPGRSKSAHIDSPDKKFTYSVHGTGDNPAPSSVTTQTLREDQTYGTSVSIYDGMLQLRQTQTDAFAGSGGRLISSDFYDTHGWQSAGYATYSDPDHAPGTTLWAELETTIPSESRTVYDGLGRPVQSQMWAKGSQLWHSSTAYPGADEVDSTPPAGGQTTSAVTNGLGQTIATTVKDTTPARKLTAGTVIASGSSYASNSVRLTMQADGNLVLSGIAKATQLWASGTGGNPGASATIRTDGSLVVTDTTGTVLWNSNSGTTGTTGAYLQIRDDASLQVFSATGVSKWTSGTAGKAAAADDTTKYTYTPAGQTASVSDAVGNTWTYQYDIQGELLSQHDPDAGDSSYVYDAYGHLVQTTDPRGQTLSYTYDVLNRQTAEYAEQDKAVHDPATKLASWTFDTLVDGTSVKGLPSSETRYVGGTQGSRYVSRIDGYNTAYQPTSVSTVIPSAEGALAKTYTSSATYSPNVGLLDMTTYGADGGLPGETIGYDHNLEGLLVGSGSDLTPYLDIAIHTPLGQIEQSTYGLYGKQLRTNQTYDAATQRPVTNTVSLQTAATAPIDTSTYGYDASGNLNAVSDVQSNGTSTTGTDTQCYAYDGQGRLAEAWSDTAGITTPAIAGTGQLAHCNTTVPSASTVGGPAPYWQSYTYDLLGDRTQKTQHDPAGNALKNTTQTVSFPSATASAALPNQASTVTTSNPTTGTATSTLNYQDASRLPATNAGNLISRSTKTDGPFVSSVKTTAGGALCLADSGAHTDDGTPQILWGCGASGQTYTVGTDGTVTVLGKCLDTAVAQPVAGTGVVINTCAAGKATQQWKTTANNTLVNVASGLCLADPAANQAPGTKQILWTCGAGGQTYTTPATGTSLAAGQTQTFTYDAEGRTASVVTGDGTSPKQTSYLYDASGHLLIERDPGKTVLYLFGGTEQLTLDTTTHTVSGQRYYSNPDGTQILRTSSGTLTYLPTNAQGTAQLSVDATTLAITRRAFDPYGAPRGTTPSPWADNHGYLGKPTDPVSGLDLLGARDYDPTIGRFLTVDPLFEAGDPSQMGGYAYAGDDPVNGADPAGLMCFGCGSSGGFAETATLVGSGGGGSGGSGNGTAHHAVQAGWGVSWGKALDYAAGGLVAGLGITAVGVCTGSEVGALLDAACYEAGATAGAAICGYITHGDCGPGAAEDPTGNSEHEDTPRGRAEEEAPSTTHLSAQDPNSTFTSGERARSDFASGSGEGTLSASKLYDNDVPSKAHPWTPDEAEPGKPAEAASPSSSKSGTAKKPVADDAATSEKCSFSPGTPVLLDHGKTKPIGDVTVGDKVESGDPNTGKHAGPHTVTATWVNYDTDLIDVTVKGADGKTATLHTTANHPFWDDTTHTWTPAADLHPGDTLNTATNHHAAVLTLHLTPGAANRYNLTVDQLHTYYVVAGGTPVLVHNSNGCGVTRGPDGRFQSDPNRVAPNAIYDRVTLRSSTKQAVQDAAPRDADGNFIDPNTGQSIPAEGPFHYGHKPGFEYWRNRDMVQAQGWTREQFIEFENDPSHYQIEDPYNNMSHQYEQP
ncbi:GH-E family nuclease [Actinacidiphila paucisporea]|uniref:GH-E family nuclease n=1 Tax=Actinacidiphila paucisporea TaxID=310782 RepID=UPI00093756A0|nr:GH-E family nuclease [Actinacidiphila paucisporea]